MNLLGLVAIALLIQTPSIDGRIQSSSRSLATPLIDDYDESDRHENTLTGKDSIPCNLDSNGEFGTTEDMPSSEVTYKYILTADRIIGSMDDVKKSLDTTVVNLVLQDLWGDECGERRRLIESVDGPELVGISSEPNVDLDITTACEETETTITCNIEDGLTLYYDEPKSYRDLSYSETDYNQALGTIQNAMESGVLLDVNAAITGLEYVSPSTTFSTTTAKSTDGDIITTEPVVTTKGGNGTLLGLGLGGVCLAAVMSSLYAVKKRKDLFTSGRSNKDREILQEEEEQQVDDTFDEDQYDDITDQIRHKNMERQTTSFQVGSDWEGNVEIYNVVNDSNEWGRY